MDDQEPQQGQIITITNQSEELPEGSYFLFRFQACAFAYDSAITCQLQTQDHRWSFEGYFWTPGAYKVNLFGITQEGDTFEMQPEVEINVMPLSNIPPSDSCHDTAAFSCTNNNLVCNGSFEWNAQQVNSLSNINLAAPWRDLLTHPDLFNQNSLSPNITGIPGNYGGYQYAQQGQAYMGIATTIETNQPFTTEVVTAPLKKNLLSGQRYSVELYLSKSDYSPWSLSGIQVGFSISELNATNYADLLTQVNSSWVLDPLGNTYISDTVNWVQFSDVIIPDTSDISWIMAGFLVDTLDILKSFDSSVTNPHWPGLFDKVAYYYLDNVSVRPLPPLVSMMQDTVLQAPCDTVELSVVGQGAGGYIWNTGDTTSTIKVSVSKDSTFTVTVSDPEDCHDTVLTVLVRLFEPKITQPLILGNNNDCDSIVTYYPSSGDSSYTYDWYIPNNRGQFTENSIDTITRNGPLPVEVYWTNVPSSPPYATIILEVYNACQEYLGNDTLEVYPCCELYFVDTTWNNDTLTDTIITGSQILINGTLTIDAQSLVHFNDTPGGHIFMGPMARIKVVNPNTTLQFDNWTISAGCDHMWDGIYLDDSSQLFKASETVFKDALQAVVSDSGAMLEINECLFRNNYKSILVRDFHLSDRPSIKANGKHWPVAVFGNEFFQSGFPSQSLPYPPKNNTFTASAIEMHNADSIIIGKLDTIPNIFYQMQQAIRVHNSNAEIINNDFHHITTGLGTYPPAGAIEVYNTDSVKIPVAYTRIGNGDTSGLNSFDTCNLAISGYKSPLSVNYNTFLDCAKGIHCLELKSNTFIENNLLEQTSPNSLTGVTGITIANVVSSSKLLNLKVDSNYIQGYKKGIWATNVDKPIPGNTVIKENNIHFNVLAMRITGIKLDNSDGMLVKENEIRCIERPDSTMNIGRHNGIWSNNTQGALITHNHLLRMGNGVYTTGANLNTYFICNTLDTCYYGFYFGESTSLSHQGVLDEYNTANHWFGDYSKNGCSYWRRMMQVPNNITNPVINWYYPNTYSLYDPGTNHCGPNHPLALFVLEIENNGAQTDCQIFNPQFDAYSINSTEDRELLLGDIARQQTQYDTLQSSFREKEGDFFYRIALNDPQILTFGDTADFTYQQYYHQLNQGKTGIKESIYDHIHQGEYIQAYALNETLPDTSRRDALRNDVNRIYLDSWCKQRFTFSPVESDSLNAYAYGNPYALGDGVFSARVLIGLDPDEVPLTQREEVSQQQETKASVQFYPNPGREKICFEWGSEDTDSQLEFTLFDSFGKQLLSRSIHTKPGEICVPLPSHLSPGLYVVRVSERSGNQASGKIIIQ